MMLAGSMRRTMIVVASILALLVGCHDNIAFAASKKVRRKPKKRKQAKPKRTARSTPTLAPQGDPAGLAGKSFTFPVYGVKRTEIHDGYAELRSGGRTHQAIDIMAPLGTPVLAFEDGVLEKFHESHDGGHTIYQFDPDRNYVYYYAHLDRRAENVSEGGFVHRGDVIGYVGFSGNAQPEAPHLHFEIGQLGPEKQWWKSLPLNPYQHLVGSEFSSVAALAPSKCVTVKCDTADSPSDSVREP